MVCESEFSETNQTKVLVRSATAGAGFETSDYFLLALKSFNN